MKKYFSNIRTLAALLIASAALAACSNDESGIIDKQTVIPTEPKTYTLTINATKDGAATRALSLDGEKLVTSWETTDVVQVFKAANRSGCTEANLKGTISPVAGTISSDGQSATFKGTISGVAADDNLLLVYHPAAFSVDGFAGQAGTLASASTLDCATAPVTVATVSGTDITISETEATFTTHTAMLKLTLTTDGTTTINPTQLKMTMSAGGTTLKEFTFSPSAATYTANGNGILYCALPSAADVAAGMSTTTNALAAATITYTATVGSDTYTAAKTGYAFAAGKYYAGTLTMAKPATDLSMVDCAGNARDKQWTANCYMIHTAGDYKLPLVYGNAIKDGATNDAAYTGIEHANTTKTFPRHDGSAITAPSIKDNGITVASAELLWQDAEGLVTAVGIDGDYLTLTVGKDATTQEGNAVVAAKDSDGNIVWSWHIWVTKQTFAEADLTTVATGSHDYKVTPVNLGWVGDAVSQGTNTFYQWGRKDPFPGTGSVTFESSTTATIADNIQNPTTFYYNSINYGPCNTTYYNMWDAQQTSVDENIASPTVKTVYDPSPAGFCVPTGNLYYYIKNGSGVSFAWDGTNKGRTLSSVTPNVFFPASGYRYDSSGTLYGVGSSGCYWSASPNSGSNGRTLYFSSGYWGWSYDSRANGFPVRAVAEE